MVSLGSQFIKIELKYFYKDYRGIVATSNIGKGDVFVFVPKNGMITLSMAKQGRIGKKLVESGANLIYPNNSFLSTYVLTEINDPNSKWKLFIDALPKSVDNFPIFFSPKERQMLTGSGFLDQVQDLKDDMEKDYKKICQAAPEFKSFGKLEDFMKTRALVNSRIFGTKIDGQDDDSIVPLAGILT
jgi:hypothetical protein